MLGNIRNSEYLEKIKNSEYSSAITHTRILGFLIVSSFLINTYFGFKLPVWNDEAIIANAAISFLQNGTPNFLSGFEYWRSFPFTLLVGASGKFFGFTDLALRLPSIIFGTLTIGLTYVVGKEFFDRNVGLIGSAILVFSALQIAWASQIRMYAMLQFLYLLTVLIIYRAVEKREIKYMLFLSSTLLLISFVHVTGLIFFFVTFFYWIYRENFQRLNSMKFGVLFPLIILTVGLALEVYSELSFVYLFNRLNFFPENISYYYNLVFRNIPSLTLLGLSGSLIALKKNLEPAILMILAVFPALQIYILHYDGVADRFIYFSIPFLAIWAGLTILTASRKLKILIGQNLNTEINFRLIAALLTVFAILAGSGFNYEYSDGEYRPTMDEKSVYNYIEEEGNKEDILITQWTPTATYYYRAPDYSLYGDTRFRGFNSTPYREKYSFNGSEIYSGAKFIDNNQELLRVVRANENGWIVLRDDTHWRKSDKIRQTLSQLVEVGDFRGMKVWKWNSSINTQLK